MRIFDYEKRWSRSVAQAQFGDEKVDSVHDARFPALLNFFSMGSAQGLWAYRVGLLLIVTAPLWQFRHFKLFPRLPLEERASVLRSLLEHRWYAVRELAFMVKMSLVMLVIGDESVRSATHYDEHPWEKEAISQSGERRRLLVLGGAPANETEEIGAEDEVA